MLQGIENIVFDLGGVMIDLDRARCVEEFHKIGFTEIDDLIDSYHPKGFLGRLERGDVTNDDFYDYVRRSAGRDIADDEIRRAFTSFLAGIPAVDNHFGILHQFFDCFELLFVCRVADQLDPESRRDHWEGS